MTTQPHHDHVEKQLGSRTCKYLTSIVYASGRDLQYLTMRLADYPGTSILDMGCGVEHVSLVIAQDVNTMVAYDLSAHMLDVMAQAAKARQLKSITTRQGYAESLPFADNAFDIVISRYFVHHRHDVGVAPREMDRILKPDGRPTVMDIISPGHLVHDIWLQAVEVLHDISHIRNYISDEWLTLVSEANLIVDNLITDKLPLEFSSWVAKMCTPEALVDVIRTYQQSALVEAGAYFVLRDDGFFTNDIIMVDAHKAA